MKRTTLLLTLALSLSPMLASAGGTVRFGSAKASAVKLESAQILIKGTSSLHDWQVEGSTVNGSISTDPSTWLAAGNSPASISVSIPVSSIKSDHSRMDRIMRDALKSDKNPDITYQLSSAARTSGTGDSFVVHTNGKLTIAGATHDMVMDVTALRTSDRHYVLTGEVPIRMTDYGFKPPVAMLGTLKTGNDVKVSFRWVVERIE